ncbi:MAG: C69 family dipeptidase [Bacteroidetes bacterium]|nr:C69 family dipeptidase [Bacteroidota bacterium]
MKKRIILPILFILLVKTAFPCTNIIVTKGASNNESTMIAYLCDGEFHPTYRIFPAADYAKGEYLNITDYAGKILGRIPQLAHTYKVMGYHDMNEFQVAMGETTFGGREELIDTTAFLNYWQLMNITLQRAKTAREAIKVLTELVEKYGYASSGESFSIADPNEAWLLEMIGTGPKGKAPAWVALKIPDGYICAHANKSRIGEFPLNDSKNCLYSKNIISFAIKNGYYNPKSGKPFKFNEAYAPSTPSNLRYCSTRVWSIYRRVAPSLNLSSDYNRAVKGANRYPLWIKPEKKLGVDNVMSLVRDHYEGTEFDMTKGLAAGPFGNPNRCRPLVCKSDSTTVAWERAISTYNTGFSIITQSRSSLPNEIGGLTWYGVDDAYFTCYTPIYAGATDVDTAFKTGSMKKFSWESAWWRFNLVANYANTKFSYISKDVKKVQNEIEGYFLQIQDSIENQALMIKDKNKRIKYLTSYSIKQGDYVMKKWENLAFYIFTKYNDGYVRSENNRPQAKGYSNEWKKRVLKDDSNFKLPLWKNTDKAKEPTSF